MPTTAPKYAFFLLPLAGASVGISTHFWLHDDAFISFRYARNFAAGLGLVYNPDAASPVEGYSNLLWVLIAGVCEFVRLPPDLCMPALSALGGLFLLWRVYDLLLERGRCDPLTASLACLSLAVFPPFTVWSTSGMETMPFALLVFLTFEDLLVKEGRSIRRACVWAVLLCGMRSDGFAWAIALGCLGLVFREDRREVLTRYMLVVLCAFGAHALFRHGYYGAWWPNATTAKFGLSFERWVRGWNYDVVFVLTYLVPVAAIFAIYAVTDARHRKLVIRCGLLLAGVYAYAIVIGGDYMPMGRFLVPSLAFQTLLIGSFCGFLRARNFERSARLFALAIAALGVLPDFDTQLVPQSIRERFPFRLSNTSFWEEKDAWRGMKEISPLLRERGEALARFTKPGESLVASSIGYVGYYSNLIIYDRFGLVSRIRPSGAAKRLGSPGHDVHVHPHYFLRQKPTYLYSMFYDEQRLKALAGRRERYPPPYAPVVFPIAEDRYLVLIKRHDSRQAYQEAWQSYENTYADSPGAR